MTRTLTATWLLLIMTLAWGCSSQRVRSERNWTPGKTAAFHARNELKVMVPDGAKHVRVWFATPKPDEPGQVITNFRVTCPHPYSIETDSEGNQQVYVELSDPKEKDFTIVETFDASREEVMVPVKAEAAHPITEQERAELAAYLSPNKNVVINDDVRKLADEIAGSETNPVTVSRKLYDWELANVDYWVKDPRHHQPSLTGNTEYCMVNHTGNCGDFHSLYMSLARAKGIPTRMVYGSLFKPELDGKDEDGSYHCWVEFYAPALGWVPVDVALANLYYGKVQINADNEKLMRMTTAYGRYDGPDDKMTSYYFGDLDERRVVWSRGRDLTLSPKQECGPVNALPKAYVEIDGKVGMEKTAWARKFTYTENGAK